MTSVDFENVYNMDCVVLYMRYIWGSELRWKKNRINRQKYGALISNNNHPFPRHGEEGTVQFRLIGRGTRGLVEKEIIRGGVQMGFAKKCNAGNLKNMKILKRNIKKLKINKQSQIPTKPKCNKTNAFACICPPPRGSIQSRHSAN